MNALTHFFFDVLWTTFVYVLLYLLWFVLGVVALTSIPLCPVLLIYTWLWAVRSHFGLIVSRWRAAVSSLALVVASASALMMLAYVGQIAIRRQFPSLATPYCGFWQLGLSLGWLLHSLRLWAKDERDGSHSELRRC